MSWVLPAPLLLLAAVAVLIPLAYLGCRPVSVPRLMVEAFATTLGIIAGFWLAWIALWLLEQHW